MSTTQPVPAPLSPVDAARLVEFARACRAAVRAVSLYPGGHPAIGVTLERLVETTASVTQAGTYPLQVLPDNLLVGGAGLARGDVAVSELAELLHRHAIGALALHTGTDADSWRTMLLLLVRAPEEIRAEGGIARLWEKQGGPSIEVQEIDYAEVLRERAGADARTLDEILAACLKGTVRLALDDPALQVLSRLANDADRLAELTAALAARTASAGVRAQSSAFLRMLRGLTEYVARTQPDRLETVLTNAATAAGKQLSVEVMGDLLSRRRTAEADAGGIDVVDGIAARMNDAAIAEFVARAVVARRGPSARLAEAFQALVPDIDRQRQILAIAESQVAAAGVDPEEDEDFPHMWQRVERMLVSYTDESYVSDAYARELSAARTQAVQVERTGEDPPDRIAAWNATVSDASLRSLDLHLLGDLLRIERDPFRWRDLATLLVSHINDLARVGQIDAACDLVEALGREAGDDGDPVRRPHALAALEQLGTGQMVLHALKHLRASDDEQFARLQQLCQTFGPVVISVLAEALAAEQDARSRRRLREILISFGARGRESARQLMNSPNWEVRRTAAYLLREFGGSDADALSALEPLLNDTEPLVQREAIQALVLIGDDAAFDLIVKALRTGTSGSRNALVQELSSTRDERAAPLFCHLLRQVTPFGGLGRVSDVSIEALGATGGPGAVEALKYALQQRRWWAPLRTRALRAAAAAALRKVGTPPAVDALRDAAQRGPRGIRNVAMAELARVGQAR